jgi:soluble lytic murein transglycosylase-like protein
MKIKTVVKGVSGAVAIVVVSHFYSTTFLGIEGALVDLYQTRKALLVERIATSAGYEIPKPELDEMTATAIVTAEATKRGVNPALARSLMRVESTMNQFAISNKGAIGYMQVMPFNAKRCGLAHPRELLDERKNIRCGVQILDEELKAHNDNAMLAIQSYNGGPKCVNRCGESMKHVAKVMTDLSRDIG